MLICANQTGEDNRNIKYDASHVSPNGEAIAVVHPLGMSGARMVTTAVNQLYKTGGKYVLCTMCVGVGQGLAIIIERTNC